MVRPQWIFYIFLIVLPIASQAQSDNSLEQLQRRLRETAPDTNRLQLLLKLGKHYLFRQGSEKSDVDSAFLYLHEAKTLCETLHLKEDLSKTMILIIKCHNETKDLQTVRNLCQSLIDKYQKSGETEAEAIVWHWLGTNMDRNDTIYPTNFYSLEQAGRCYQKIGNKEKEIEMLKEIADIYLTQGNLAKSEEELLKVLDMYKSIGFRKLHYTYDLLASVSTQRGNLNRALVYAIEAIKSMEATATGDSNVVSQTFYYRLARIYDMLGQTAQSVEWYKKAYAKGKNANLVSLGRGLIKLGRVQEALDFVQNFIRESPPVATRDKALIATTLGDCYNALQQYDLAEKYYLEMVRYERLLEERGEYTALVNFTIGRFYVTRYRYHEAEPYLKKILTIPGGIVSPHRLKDAHLLLFKVDSAAGNYLSAIRHIQLHKLLNDSIFNETKSRQIEEFQIQYETEKKVKDIALLQNEKALQQNALQQANLAKNITFGTGSLLLVILGLLYNRYRLKQRVNNQLEIQQREINLANRALQNLLEEKERLLREIHHRVKNNLQIVMSLLNSQSVFLENDKALDAIRDSQQRIHSISLIHQKLYQSENISLIDMSAYIRELTEYLQGSFGTGQRIRFDLQTEPVELDVTQAVPVGLILNEAISNAVKYAFSNGKAGTVTVSMRQTGEEQFVLSVADNGWGLPKNFDINKSNSLGMSLMRGLSKQLNGSFELKNEHGLTVAVTFEKEHIVDVYETS